MAVKQRPGSSRTSPAQTKTLGQAEKGSRQKATSAVDRANSTQSEEGVHLSPTGKPLARIRFSASELIPTGNYANVTIGPYEVTMWVDPDEPNGGVTDEQLENITDAANELVQSSFERVMGVQRALVLDSLNMNSEGE